MLHQYKAILENTSIHYKLQTTKLEHKYCAGNPHPHKKPISPCKLHFIKNYTNGVCTPSL